MYDPVHHAESGKISTLLKGVPAKVCYHFCDTAFSAVVICNKSGCSSLDHLDLFGVGVAAQVVAAYSTIRRTNVLYAVTFAACGADRMFLLRNLMVEFAFFATLFACLLQDKSLLNVLPDTLPQSLCSTSGCGWCSLSKGASFY